MAARCLAITSLLFLGLWSISSKSLADNFSYINDEGKRVEVEAKLYATGSGVLALERNDGSIELVPEARVMQRTPS